MGIDYDGKGFVKEISAYSQAHSKSISKVDHIVKVCAKKYSKHAVVNAEKNGADYEATFKVKKIISVLPHHVTLVDKVLKTVQTTQVAMEAEKARKNLAMKQQAVCRPVCANHKDSWPIKCEWQICSDCSECVELARVRKARKSAIMRFLEDHAFQTAHLGKTTTFRKKVTYPLHEAAKRNDVEMVKMLIDERANVNQKNSRNQTPLERAIAEDKNGSHKLLIEILQGLLGTSN
jgi:hypothetical protein